MLGCPWWRVPLRLFGRWVWYDMEPLLPCNEISWKYLWGTGQALYHSPLAWEKQIRRQVSPPLQYLSADAFANRSSAIYAVSKIVASWLRALSRNPGKQCMRILITWYLARYSHAWVVVFWPVRETLLLRRVFQGHLCKFWKNWCSKPRSKLPRAWYSNRDALEPIGLYLSTSKPQYRLHKSSGA